MNLANAVQQSFTTNIDNISNKNNRLALKIYENG